MFCIYVMCTYIKVLGEDMKYTGVKENNLLRLFVLSVMYLVRRVEVI